MFGGKPTFIFPTENPFCNFESDAKSLPIRGEGHDGLSLVVSRQCSKMHTKVYYDHRYFVMTKYSFNLL